MRVLGVDGCVGGWIVVELTDGAVSDCRFATSFAEVVAADATAIGVDIPLGEPPDISDGGRTTDQAARDFLEGRAKACVFSAPPWAVSLVDDYAIANPLARELTGKGLTKQSHALRNKIVDATPHWRAAPHRVHEVHPEVSFQALAGHAIGPSKKTWAGNRARLALLASAGIVLPDDVGEAGAKGATDDVVDAAVVAWSATRIARGEAESLPEPPEHDGDGRPVAIWY